MSVEIVTEARSVFATDSRVSIGARICMFESRCVFLHFANLRWKIPVGLFVCPKFSGSADS